MARDSYPAGPRRAVTPGQRDVSGASAALQLLPVAALLVDDAGVVLSCNELFADEVGAPVSLLVGRPWWQAFAPRSERDARAAMQAVLDGGQALGTTLVAMAETDERVAELAIAWRRMTEPVSGRVVWLFAVTSWRRHAAGAARGAGPTLSAGALDGWELAAAVVDELAGGERAAHPRATAEGLRAMLERGRGEGERARASDLVAAALGALPDANAARAVRVVDESRAYVTRGRPDPVRLLAHLVADALDRVTGGARVELRTYDEPGFACVAVRAEGAPFPPEALASASDAVFARAGTDADRGLPLVRAIARSLGGWLALANDPAEAGGSVAVLALPVVSATPSAAPPAPSWPPRRAASGPLAGRSVLVVDDDAQLARGLGRVLATAGADPTVVNGTAEALAALESGAHDALVTDFQLADGDGLALVRRAAQREPPVRAVLVTALIDPSLVALATQMGAGAVLQKPFDPAKLVAVLAELFGPDA